MTAFQLRYVATLPKSGPQSQTDAAAVPMLKFKALMGSDRARRAFKVIGLARALELDRSCNGPSSKFLPAF